MARPKDNTSSRDLSINSWEDDGGCVQPDWQHRDLNSLLAQEQISIMNAEIAVSGAAYEFHRDASLHTRQLVNATPYPEHGPHVFAQERAGKTADYGESLKALKRVVERNERLLAREFADGQVSGKAFQNRSRFLRQDRAKIVAMSHAARTENAS
ncbi:hypothetical protein DM806_21815 [Sphingobium lactosutens]|uniref:hypothetical protein n=1 Tax=Sphingobium lactosutens TaxID=522773 RepID=UPI0015B9BBE2|nr:hypothetical protein [Sphingobium lactosutens]NWK94117.1 hypothetical protein [Sphingobium lactosutens]NWK94185.1 hypothetical protein [Sphingobium lactosutens]NWK94696.1 hypothetical protein [Sphingobium lactosutens]NWK98252.1 hypothetical protein [Sphingobium lactosutens]